MARVVILRAHVQYLRVAPQNSRYTQDPARFTSVQRTCVRRSMADEKKSRRKHGLAAFLADKTNYQEESNPRQSKQKAVECISSQTTRNPKKRGDPRAATRARVANQKTSHMHPHTGNTLGNTCIPAPSSPNPCNSGSSDPYNSGAPNTHSSGSPDTCTITLQHLVTHNNNLF